MTRGPGGGVKLNFFKLIVTDMAGNIAFFESAFGFAVRNRFDLPDIEEVVLSLPGETFGLVLFRWKDGRGIVAGNSHGPVGLLSSDVDADYARALSAGARTLRAPFDLGAVRIAFLAAPEGHEIELIRFPAAAAEEAA